MPATVGKVVPGYTARVVDDEGKEVPRGTIGKLAVIGPSGCKYLEDPRQANYVKDGWNYPGDAFLQDADGYFFYQSRADDTALSSAGELYPFIVARPVGRTCSSGKRMLMPSCVISTTSFSPLVNFTSMS